MLFSEARKHDVVSTATATRLARVDGFVVAAGPPRVALLRLAKVSGDGSLLSWDDVQGFGPDAVTVADESAIRPPGDDFEQRADSKDLDVLGKRLLTERGDELGQVSDVDFDPETGEVTALLVEGETVAGHRLVGVGAYAAVVSV